MWVQVVTTRISDAVSLWWSQPIQSGELGFGEYLSVPSGARSAYQYTATRTRYSEAGELPAVKFTWDLAPLQIIVSANEKVPSLLTVKLKLAYEEADAAIIVKRQNSGYRFGSFLTSLCAVVGGWRLDLLHQATRAYIDPATATGRLICIVRSL